MLRTEAKEFLLYQGEYFDVEFYYDDRGDIKAWEDFEGLSLKDKASFFVRIEKLANSVPGTIHPKTIFNLENADKKIWAIKFGTNRFCSFFYEGGKIIITNAYVKKTQKNGKREEAHIQKAISYKDDYEKRVKERIYYQEGED